MTENGDPARSIQLSQLMARTLAPLVLALMAPRAAGGQACCPELLVKTKLGVETRLAVEMATSREASNLVLSVGLRGTGWTSSFLLETDGGYSLSIPIKRIRSCNLKDGKHVLTLRSGEQLIGRLRGTILARPGSRPYELSSMATVVVEGTSSPDAGRRRFANNRVELGEQTPKDLWTFQSGRAETLLVYEPRFHYRYWSSAGYVRGGTWHRTHSGSFDLEVRGDTLQGRIEDFASVSLDKGNRITVTAQDGTQTSGNLLLFAHDSRGRHTAGSWILAAYLSDASGLGPDDPAEAIMLLTDSPMSLRQGFLEQVGRSR